MECGLPCVAALAQWFASLVLASFGLGTVICLIGHVIKFKSLIMHFLSLETAKTGI